MSLELLVGTGGFDPRFLFRLLAAACAGVLSSSTAAARRRACTSLLPLLVGIANGPGYAAAPASGSEGMKLGPNPAVAKPGYHSRMLEPLGHMPHACDCRAGAAGPRPRGGRSHRATLQHWP